MGIFQDLSYVMTIATQFAPTIGYINESAVENRIKRLYFDFLFVRQFEILLEDDMAFVGFTFDEHYLGRPQTYSELWSK